MGRIAAAHSSESDFHKALAREIVGYWRERGYAANASAVQVEIASVKGEPHLAWRIVSNISPHGYPPPRTF
ncbi:MAG TPA: hypothetical protein VGR45_02140 [Stellaceae bacterium]|nr:hypothetical protein [Stellaceae bacterium]